MLIHEKDTLKIYHNILYGTTFNHWDIYTLEKNGWSN